MRTLQQHIAQAGGLAAMQNGEQPDPLVRRIIEPGGAVPFFVCRCGRHESAKRMVDLDDPAVPPGLRIPPAVRRDRPNGRGRPGSDTDRFICFGCWTRWIGKGLIDRNAWRRATAQPELPARSRMPW